MRTGLFTLIACVAALPIIGVLFSSTGGYSSAALLLFEREEASLLPFALFGLVVWNRLATVALLPDSENAQIDRVLAVFLTIGGIVMCAWALHVNASDLYCLSLAMLTLATCVRWKGAASLAQLKAPIGVALLVPLLPAPIYNEIVWFAQRAVTDVAALLLTWFGQELDSGSILISIEGYDFWVIETCSGLRTVELLILISILLLEMSPRRERFDFLLILAAGPIALVLNLLRIVAVVLFRSEVSGDVEHTTQGLIAVFFGTLLLFGLCRFGFPWFGRTRGLSEVADSRGGASGGLGGKATMPTRIWLPVGFAVSLIVFGVRGLPSSDDPLGPIEGVSTALHGWVAADLESNRLFFNSLPIGRSLHRRYEREREGGRGVARVDVYLAQEDPRLPRASLWSSKFGWLGPGWDSESGARVALWQVSASGVWSRATRGKAESLVLVWRKGREGGLRDVLSAALGTDAVFPSEEPARVFRLSTEIRPARSEAIALENAEKLILEFLDDFAANFEIARATMLPVDRVAPAAGLEGEST